MLFRLPPIDRYRMLGTYGVWGGNPSGTYKRLVHALGQRQENPDLEQMRRAVWRSYVLFAVCVLSFPITIFGVIIQFFLMEHPPTS